MGAADEIRNGLTKNLANFTKQRKAEEKHVSAGRWRTSRIMEVRGKFLKEAADEVMEECYLKASDNGNLPATARQIFYVARRELIKSLATGDVQVLTNCGLISEGLDVPGVVAAILQRPTKSLALYLQQVGRALRPAPGKAKALILDHSGNAYRFGLADAPRSWSHDGWGKARSGAAAVCRCRECGALNPITARHRDACGAQLREPRPPIPSVEVRSGQLIEIDRLQAMTHRRALRWAGESEDRLRLVAGVRGYKRRWVWHGLRELRDEDAA